MSGSTIPSQPGGQTFVSCHRYDPFRRFIIRFLMPVVGAVAMFAFLVLDLFFYLSLRHQIPEEFRGTFLGMVGAVGLMGLTVVIGFLALAWNLNRRYFGTSIECDGDGLHYRSGKKRMDVPWGAVRIGRVLDLARMQSAVLETPQGRIRIDPSFVDETGPHPKSRVSFGKEFLVYPDGTRVPYKIRENVLFRLIEEHTGVSTAQSSLER